LWDSREAAKAAELVVQKEEEGAVEGDGEAGFSIPEEARVHDVDILEIDPVTMKQSVVLRTKPFARSVGYEEHHVFIQW